MNSLPQLRILNLGRHLMLFRLQSNRKVWSLVVNGQVSHIESIIKQNKKDWKARLSSFLRRTLFRYKNANIDSNQIDKMENLKCLANSLRVLSLNNNLIKMIEEVD